jgi:long-chain acyl-CoA synthetase
LTEPAFDLSTAPFRPLPSRVADQAAARPNAIALISGDERLSWPALVRRSTAVAAGLQELGVRKGDRVAMIASLSISSVLLMLGAIEAGAAIVPLSPKLDEATLARMIADCQAHAIYVDAAVLRTLPNLEGVRPLGEAFGASAATSMPVDLAAGDLFDIVYSSGTTGVPKGIKHSHAQRDTLIGAGRGLSIDQGSIYLICTSPSSHTTLSSLFSSLGLGATVVLMEHFDEGHFLRQCATHRVTHTTLVPIQYRRLLDHPDFDATDLSSFRTKLSSGSMLAVDIKRELLARWPGRLIEIYGMTEGGPTCLLDATARPDKLHTVGLPAPGCDIRIIDESGDELSIGAVGEIVGRSAINTDGYLNRDDATTAASWRSAAGDLYHRSGDLGCFDADGFIEIRGRKKDMILSGALNIYPADIEAVIERHPAVVEAAVIAVPSERWGETPYAFVVLDSDSAPVEVAALLDWVNANVNRTQRLSGLELIDALPRNDMGKVVKADLRRRFWEEAT